MKEREKLLILEFKRKLPPEVGRHMRKLIVYGSRARGEAEEGSDLDLIALVDERTLEIEQMIEDVAYQVMWDHDFKPIISLKIFAESDFNHAVQVGFSFYRHIAKEGIPL